MHPKVLQKIAVLLTVSILVSGCFGPFAVSGKVVDEHGNPLSDVQLHTTASVQTDHEIDAYGGESSTILSDGRFKVRCWSCSAVHLFFAKDGYHPKAVDLAFFEWRRDLTIVLRKRGPAVDLDEYETKINVGPGFDDTFMVFAEKQARALTAHEIASESNTSNPPIYVSLIPSVNADGSLAIETKEFMAAIKYADLDFSAANGAAQLYEPTDVNFTYAYAEMTEAPIDGYSPTIRLENKQEGQFFFFYCIIDEHYCKGAVSAPRIWQADGRARVQVTIQTFINPIANDRSLDDPKGYLR